MGRFPNSGDWVANSIQMKGESAFIGVIFRRDDPAAIWRWVCSHRDHTTAKEALSCAQGKLGDSEPVGIVPQTG
jgi:hypothetical protein